jgi:protein-S-isoprenylcysteine O-methyltransferase Ste14
MDIISRIHKSTTYLSHDFLGGPRLLKFNWVINFQKGMTIFWVLGLMLVYDNFTPQAWVYLALHGSYGIIWIFKDVTFPDSKWQTRITFGGAAMAVMAVLGPYWVAPYLLISAILGESHSAVGWFGLSSAIFIYALGLTLMLTADAQKYFTLKLQKGLITSGMFSRIRHPNYLGEMLIYGSFALIVHHWIPWAILAWVWLGYFWVNILMKERSMSRYAEWEEYRARSNYLIPHIF